MRKIEIIRYCQLVSNLESHLQNKKKKNCTSIKILQKQYFLKSRSGQVSVFIEVSVLRLVLKKIF